jgi:hypothetical protein
MTYIISKLRLLRFAGIVCLVITFGCKKSSSPVPDPGPDKISVDIDGIKSSFNNGAIARWNQIGFHKFIDIVGCKGIIGSSNSINLTIDRDTFTIGTYSEWPDVQAHLSFIQYSLCQGFNSHARQIDPATITITQITKTTLIGTFQGVIFTNPDGTGNSKTMTNGQFSLNFGQ